MRVLNKEIPDFNFDIVSVDWHRRGQHGVHDEMTVSGSYFNL